MFWWMWFQVVFGCLVVLAVHTGSDAYRNYNSQICGGLDHLAGRIANYNWSMDHSRRPLATSGIVSTDSRDFHWWLISIALVVELYGEELLGEGFLPHRCSCSAVHGCLLRPSESVEKNGRRRLCLQLSVSDRPRRKSPARCSATR